MSGDQDPAQVARAFAAIRAAEALLRTLGGCTIYVRIPGVSTSGDASQLGLQVIATDDVELSPAVTRALTKQKDSQRRMEITISAASLSRAKDIEDADSAAQFFNAALGIVYAEKLWRIQSLQVDDFAGTPYLYRLNVAE
jgi:hypothetical protein